MADHKLLLQDDCETPPGGVKLAGLLQGGRGIPIDAMRVLGSYAIVYLLEGSGYYRDAGGVSRRVVSGDLLILYPELAHAYGPGPGESWSELYLVFEGTVFDLWRKAGLLDSSRPVLRREPVAHWERRLRSALEPSGYSLRSRRLMRAVQFLEVLTRLLLPDAAEEKTNEGEWVAVARSLLESDLDRDLSIGEVARYVGMSYESFRKHFARQTGLSPARYRMHKRIDAARDLLRYTRMTNAQIAGNVGFKDPFYFSRRFKQIVGLSPRRYRRRR